MAEGWDPSGAKHWFADEQKMIVYTAGPLRLSPAITELVTSNAASLPPTLTLDYIRIRTLQARHETLVFQSCCHWTLEELVQSLDQNRRISTSACEDLFHRISVIMSDRQASWNPLRQTSDIALEIVRAAYKICKVSKIPSTEDIKFAESNLDYAQDVDYSVNHTLRSWLAEDLQDVVEDEVAIIQDLTPMQISNRYHSPGMSIILSSGRTIQETELLRMAQLIAHISVLHWRVWAPLLYEASADTNGD